VKVIEFKLKNDVLFDEIRAGGRINLIIGRSLTAKARRVLEVWPASTTFRLSIVPATSTKGFTLATKNGGACLRDCRKVRGCVLALTANPR